MCFDSVYHVLKRSCRPVLIRTWNRHDFTQKAINTLFGRVSRQKCINYINLHCLLSQRPKIYFNITKNDIFEDKCLSQDLSCILHNTVEGSGIDVSGGREGAVIPPTRQTCDLPFSFACNSSTANTRRWHSASLMMAHHLKRYPALVHPYISLNMTNVLPMLA